MNKLILGLLGSLLLCFSSTLAHTDDAFNTVRKDISKNVKALGSNESKLGLLIEDVNVEPNQSFCVQVTTENFQEVLGMQFTLSYDPSALEFLSIGNFGVDGLNENAFGLPNQHSQIDEGTITCAWATPQLQAIELEDGSSLFELCFLAKNPSKSQLKFDDFPTAIEFSDVSEHILNFSSNDSDVNVAVDASVTNGIEVGMAEIALDSRSVNKGQMICLPVKAEEFNNIVGMQFSIDYDPNLLEFKSVGNISLAGLDGSYFGTPESSSNIEEGTLTLSWDSPGVTPISMAEGSDLFELCFEAKSSGEALVTFSEGPTPTEFIDFRNINLNHKLTDGQVTIGETASLLEGFSLNLVDANVQNVNDEICLDVAAQGFMNIIGMQFSIAYDPTALEFKSVGNFNLPGLSAATFGQPDPVGDLNAGTITLAWLEPSLAPVTVADGDAIFQMCFTALSESTSQVVFSSSPTSIEVTNSDEQNVPFNSTPSNIVVGDGGNNGGGNNGGGDGGNNGGDGGNNGGGTDIEGFALIMPNQVIQPSTDFCVPVTVQDFTDIIGMQFSMSYDPAELTFVSVGEFNLPGLSEATFGLPNGNNIPDGTITLAWLEPSLNPVTRVDGDTIFNVCFTPNFTTGSTDIDFTNTPTSIEVTNSDEQNVPATTVGSTASFDGDPGGGNEDGFKLTINDKSVRSGNQICLPVTVQDFENIIGMQFSISYDPTELEFVSVGEFNLSGLSAATFGLPTGGTNPGTITLAWLEPALAPVTLMDGDTIFEVCFNALAANGITSDVD
ncbi:MAG: cohesin domain-containing protein, partial [Bacteroidota bacterium]